MREHILIVDDEAGVRESFRIMLSDKYDVSTAKGGNECLKLLEEGKKFSLVVLDLRMPDLDGMEVLKRIKKIDAALPVIILTAVGTHQTVVEALKLGAADFIAKPADVYRVKEVVKNALLQSREYFGREAVSADELLRESFSEAIKVLAEIMQIKTPSVAEHCKWTAKYAVAIAGKLGFSQEQIEIIRHTSMLHDIGKLGIKDALIDKMEEDLTPEDKEQLRKHAEIGEKILSHFKLMHIEQTMIRHHHEKYDGSGYPDGLKGEEIPVYARIMAVANFFESITSERRPQGAVPVQEAIDRLRQGSGSAFDPKIVEVFIEIIQD